MKDALQKTDISLQKTDKKTQDFNFIKVKILLTNTSHTQKGVKLSVYNVCGAKIPLCRRQLLRADL